MQRVDAPGDHIVHVDIERRFVELDHVDAVGFQCARFLIEQFGERHRESCLVAVIAIGDGIDNRHRAGQGELEGMGGVRPCNARFGGVRASLHFDRADHHRHHRLVTVVADAHLDLVFEVDAVNEFEEAVHEMLARLLAVADDLDPGVLLFFQPQQRGVALGGFEFGAGVLPRRPQFLGFGQPERLGQAAGNGGVEQGHGDPPVEPGILLRQRMRESLVWA